MESGSAMTSASSLSTHGCMPSGPMDLWVSSLLKWSLTWSSSTKGRSSFCQAMQMLSHFFQLFQVNGWTSMERYESVSLLLYWRVAKSFVLKTFNTFVCVQIQSCMYTYSCNREWCYRMIKKWKEWQIIDNEKKEYYIWGNSSRNCSFLNRWKKNWRNITASKIPTCIPLSLLNKEYYIHFPRRFLVMCNVLGFCIQLESTILWTL